MARVQLRGRTDGGIHVNRRIVVIEGDIGADVEAAAADHRVRQSKATDREIPVESGSDEDATGQGVASAPISREPQALRTEKSRSAELTE